MPQVKQQSDNDHVADVIEIKHFLKGHDFSALEVFSHSDAPNGVTIHLEVLTGVNIPWLCEAMEDRGWHVKKVENTGEAVITCKEGTDPYIPE